MPKRPTHSPRSTCNPQHACVHLTLVCTATRHRGTVQAALFQPHLREDVQLGPHAVELLPQHALRPAAGGQVALQRLHLPRLGGHGLGDTGWSSGQANVSTWPQDRHNLRPRPAVRVRFRAVSAQDRAPDAHLAHDYTCFCPPYKPYSLRQEDSEGPALPPRPDLARPGSPVA